MHSPALALAWQTWGRHRWGLALVGAGLGGLAALYHAFPGDMARSEAGTLGFFVPFAFAFVYLTYAFSLGELGPRPGPSGFPAWMLTLPVRTPLLVVWPMASGAAAVALLWLFGARFVLRPGGVDMPLLWPGLALAVTLAWVQAIDWAPLGGLRKAVLAGLVLAGLWVGLSKPAVQDRAVWLLPLPLAAAYGAAVLGVGRLRHGGPPAEDAGWFAFAPEREAVARPPFGSAARAQLWLEVRRNGFLLPAIGGAWLLLQAAPALLTGESANPLLFLFHSFYFLAFVAPLAGPVLGKPDVRTRSLRLDTFQATRPLSAGQLVAAKLKAAALGLLAAWALMAVMTLLGGVISGKEDLLARYFRAFLRSSDRVRAQLLNPLSYRPERDDLLLRPGPALADYLLLCLGIGGLFGLIWLQVAGNLIVGLTGRLWVFLAAVVVYLVAVPDLLAIQASLRTEHPEAYEAFLDMLPWLARGAVLLKLLLAAWVFRASLRRGVMDRRLAGWLLGLWGAAAACLFGFLWLVLGPVEVSAEGIALGVVLALPLVRLGAGPLALAWNRHR